MTTTDQITQLIVANTQLKQFYEGVRDDIEDRLQNCTVKVDDHLSRWGLQGHSTLEVGVGKRFTSIQAAWNYLQGKKLAGDVLVKVADGVYSVNGIWLEHHPDAHRIRIEGNVAQPERCEIRFIPDNNGHSQGVIFRNVCDLQFSGFQLSGVAEQTYRGLRIHLNAQVRSAKNSLIIAGCSTGIEVYSGSYYAGEGIRMRDCINGAIVSQSGEAHLHYLEASARTKHHGVGIEASNTANVHAHSCHCSNFHTGFRATRSAYLWCDGSKSESCHHGFDARHNGTLWCHENASTRFQRGIAIGGHHGFLAYIDGHLLAHGARAEGCVYGFYAGSHSYLRADHSSAVNCSVYGYHADWLSLLRVYNTHGKVSGNKANYSINHAHFAHGNASIHRS